MEIYEKPTVGIDGSLGDASDAAPAFIAAVVAYSVVTALIDPKDAMGGGR